METGSLGEVSDRLRDEVESELESKPGKKWRCPKGLRSRIMSYARVCREQGEPLAEISNRLGLVESTLARWLRADREAPAEGFRSVSIIASEEGHQGEAVDSRFRLYTPAGYMVDGLDAETLAFLLRVVG